MTYEDLLDQLNQLTHEQLNMDVTIYSDMTDEFFPASSFENNSGGEADTDVLDPGHPYISGQ